MRVEFFNMEIDLKKRLTFLIFLGIVQIFSVTIVLARRYRLIQQRL